MLQKIKLTEDDYVFFEFCYVDQHELLPVLSIKITEDVISKQIINDGIYFKKVF